MGEPTPTSVYWKDDNVKDEGAPYTSTAQFRPGIKPWIHLGRLSQYYLFWNVVNNFAHLNFLYDTHAKYYCYKQVDETLNVSKYSVPIVSQTYLQA